MIARNEILLRRDLIGSDSDEEKEAEELNKKLDDDWHSNK